MRSLNEILDSAKERQRYFLEETLRSVNPEFDSPNTRLLENPLPELSDLDRVEMHMELIEAILVLNFSIRSKV